MQDHANFKSDHDNWLFVFFRQGEEQALARMVRENAIAAFEMRANP